MSIELDMFLILAEDEEGRDPNEKTKLDKLTSKFTSHQDYDLPPEEMIKPPKPGEVSKYYDWHLDQIIYLYLEDDGKDKLAIGLSEDGKKRAQVKLFLDSESGKYLSGKRNTWADPSCNIGYFITALIKYLKENSMLLYPRTQSKEISFTKPEFTEEERKFFGNPENVFDNLIDVEPIGKGGFRNVYDLGNYVLKVGNNTNSWDLAKKVNQDESNFQMQAEFPNVTAKTYKYNPDFAWIIQDKVKEVNSKSAVEDYFFPNHHPFNEQLIKLISKLYEKTSSNLNEKLEGYTPQAIELANLIKKYNIDTEDLKPKNFGETGDGRIILMDIGVHQW